MADPLVLWKGHSEGMEEHTDGGGWQASPSVSQPQKHPDNGNAEGPYAGRGGMEAVSKRLLAFCIVKGETLTLLFRAFGTALHIVESEGT